uniref:Uncharacterized protein n=1 Tax=Elaeophora elaphi TaxID=1147741 RepID=A0A0R3S615_9BILA
MILSGTPLATIRHAPPISVNSTSNDASTSSTILSELLISSNIHTPHRPLVTFRNLPSITTATSEITIPGATLSSASATDESNFTSTSPSTSSDSLVVTTLNSLISPSDHENAFNERNHQRHHHHNHHQHHHHHHQHQQNDATTVNGDYGE